MNTSNQLSARVVFEIIRAYRPDSLVDFVRTLRRAEKVLQSLDDGLRVNSEVTDEGVIVYDFLELKRPMDRLHRPEE